MKLFLSLAMIGALFAGCADNTKDYDAIARCQGLGLKAGTKEYDDCVKGEKQARMMKEQREEYERQKQEDRDWKLRRY